MFFVYLLKDNAYIASVLIKLILENDAFIVICILKKCRKNIRTLFFSFCLGDTDKDQYMCLSKITWYNITKIYCAK